MSVRRFEVIWYIIRRALTGKEQWHLNRSYLFGNRSFSRKNYCEIYVVKIVTFCLRWPLVTLFFTWHKNDLIISSRSCLALYNAVCRLSLRCLVFEISGGVSDTPPPVGTKVSQTPVGARVNPMGKRWGLLSRARVNPMGKRNITVCRTTSHNQSLDSPILTDLQGTN